MTQVSDGITGAGSAALATSGAVMAFACRRPGDNQGSIVRVYAEDGAKRFERDVFDAAGASLSTVSLYARDGTLWAAWGCQTTRRFGHLNTGIPTAGGSGAPPPTPASVDGRLSLGAARGGGFALLLDGRDTTGTIRRIEHAWLGGQFIYARGMGDGCHRKRVDLSGAWETWT